MAVVVPPTASWRTPSRMMARFMRRIEVTPSGCWEWQGRIHDQGGYGFIGSAGLPTPLVHRLMWWLRYGDPGDMYVCHHCDNPPCCNPRHLFVGTAAENSRDRDRKGRAGAPCRGEASPNARLTWARAAEIRSSSETTVDLARRFGVSETAVRHVRQGKTWKVAEAS